MAYDGTLVFDTELDANGFQTGANKLNNLVSGLGIFKLLEKGFQMVANSVDKAMGRIDTMEQFSRVMTTMTGDVSATNAALAETTEIVSGTAYGLDYAARAVQNFTSRGMEISKSTETGRAWGDAVAFYGDGSNAAFGSVTDALSKMQTKGNVTMEHMEMLLNAGIPAIEMYADAIGVTASDVTQIMSDGVITYSTAKIALDRLEIDELGLDSGDRRMLNAIIQYYNGGPVGVETLAAAIGEEAVTIEDVVEPYLMQIGFLQRTPRGRCATRAAYLHLGLTPPGTVADDNPRFDV